MMSVLDLLKPEKSALKFMVVFHAVRHQVKWYFLLVSFKAIFKAVVSTLFVPRPIIATHCCDRKSRAACAQSFPPWQQATI